MVDTMGQPEDVLRVAGERWLFRGHIHILPGSPDSDLQVSGGFGLLGDEQRFVPQGTRGHEMLLLSLSQGWCGGSVRKQGLFPFGSAPLVRPFLWCKEKNLGPAPLAPAQIQSMCCLHQQRDWEEGKGEPNSSGFALLERTTALNLLS